MINLKNFLNIMSPDCEIAVYDEDNDEMLLCGYKHTVDLPCEIYDAKVTHFLPGILTKIWIRRVEPIMKLER